MFHTQEALDAVDKAEHACEIGPQAAHLVRSILTAALKGIPEQRPRAEQAEDDRL